MSGKAIKKIHKWYRKELQTEAFKNHDAVWQQLMEDAQKRIKLYRLICLFETMLIIVGIITAGILIFWS